MDPVVLTLDAADRARVAALHGYGVLDTEPEGVFDGLAHAAAAVAGLPIALVSLVDADRQWFKARVGLDVCETGRDISFCDHVVRAGVELEVPDTLEDPRFATNPLVVGTPHIRSYAGFPLIDPAGHVLGTLCVLGDAPQALAEPQRVALRALAGQVMTQLELRSALATAQEARAEAAAARRWLGGLLEVAPCAVVACDADGHLSFFNTAARLFHGVDADPSVPPDQWAGTFDLQAEDGSTLGADEVPLRRALRGERVRSELIRIAPEGLPARSVVCDATQLRDDDGTLIGAVVVMTDISERRRASEALARSEERMRQALDALPRDITLLEAVRDLTGEPVDLRVAWINARVRAATRLELADVVGRSVVSVFPHVGPFLPEYLQVVRTGTPLHREVDRFDGSHLHGAVDLHVVPWGGDDGLLVDAADITERRATELALAASRARLEQAQQLAGIATWSWDLRSGAVTWSASLRRLLGVGEDVEATLGGMLAAVHPGDRARYQAAYAELLATGRTAALEHRVVRPDGGLRWVQAWANAERDLAGRVLRIDGSQQDVTDSRSREAALADAARRDPLTGVANRRGWEDAGARTLEELRHAGLGACVAILDLDHFKAVNDRLGHAGGDELLRTCAHRWVRSLRAGDLVARLGGEEFVVLLPGCDLDAATGLVERLRAAVPGPATVSAGLVAVAPGEDLAAAVGRADQALYRAKAAGRDRCCTA